ncbi:IclR family transcriptional regulator [Microbacterium sp. CPCC 204701]|uniref:IclR family transcriptional regulator n=1 Tax=Microbacterium sp. CPCC 204701 TaxID=2493084 RepID=UPI001F0C4F8B|nr:IclR family transcriptional regulator [Microbacterium sp. CPCC 204701]
MKESADATLGVLDRMTQILQAFDDQDRGLGLSELARHSGLPKSTVSRLVATLVRHRYLERDGRLIHLGLRVFELGELAREPRELRSVALPVMLELRDATGDDVHLAIPDGGEMVCIAAVRGRSGAPSRVRVGARLPGATTAPGKILLAHSRDAIPDDGSRASSAAQTPSVFSENATLQRQLVAIRSGELATEDREFAPDSSSLAAAFFAPGGVLVGAISVSGRTDVFDGLRAASPLRQAARTLTRRLASAGRLAQ